MQRFDLDGDGILQREEWQRMPGTPQAIDLNGDGQITRDELIWFLTHYGHSRTIHRTIAVDLSAPYRFDPANLHFFRPVWQRVTTMPVPQNGTAQDPVEGSAEAIISANEEVVDDDVYQRLLEEGQIPFSRPYHVLPETLRGVPAWFILMDRNGDGMVSLAEFAPTLAPSAVARFRRLDMNNDGFIDPNEARASVR